ncbi:hypothetical protein CKM354_000380100 [Cercospora kikuchii]|uniref:Uncharacterized protein n=1 Tax=Cercospora kikuchii TaxID=84275 RepID=A0A9P3CIJ7_9PEZI|nr:uncharacterized protein CKM354_000380100 [Cercospora kikuchii]GIZ40465.1 hypothetical protein CKM354_000380100 [Cercospora kikuchii]
MSPPSFNFNVSYSEPVNGPGLEPVLTLDDVWQGISRGARRPQDMAPYVADCQELPGGSALKFSRKLIIGGDGAVHTEAGEPIVQDVILRPGLNVEAVTPDSGATTIFGMSLGTAEKVDESRPDIYFTGVYELWIPGIQDGTKEAEEVRVKYGALARGATKDGVQTFRKWKVDGKLDEWRKMSNGSA